jgi:hypothetical protein
VSQVARILAAELAAPRPGSRPDRNRRSTGAPSETPRDETAFLDTLSENALAGLAWLFEFWALPHQCPPEGDWRTWVVLGGRGAGKTRAGTEWVRAQVEGSGPEDAGTARRVALIGETYDQAVAVMVKGDSGLLACSPPDRRPPALGVERAAPGLAGRTGRRRGSIRRTTGPRRCAGRNSTAPGPIVVVAVVTEGAPKLVWALTDGLLRPAAARLEPGIRAL